MNCWEYFKCGREEGGIRRNEFSVCPAYPDYGRTCARIAGTFCGGMVQGTFASKLTNCTRCEFYKSDNYLTSETESPETSM